MLGRMKEKREGTKNRLINNKEKQTCKQVRYLRAQGLLRLRILISHHFVKSHTYVLYGVHD